MTDGVSRPRIARSRLPWRLRLLTDPAALRHLAAVVVLAALLASIVGRSLSAADRAERRWGRSQPVLVLVDDVGPGDPLDRRALREVRWPVALVPEGALGSPPADGATAAAALVAGTPLTASAVRRPGTEPDRRTIALPLGSGALRSEAGDRVDVWAVADPTTVTDGAERAERVARDAEVVDAGEGTVTVAVADDEVEPTAAAAASAQLVLVGTR